ncbi:MAG: FprA family A-type flavoprotein [Desulfobacterales bacterium]
MKPIEIAPGIYDVGVNDWNIEDFHGYSTPLGTSYNAFLIVDEKTTLIDTVKHGFEDHLLANIRGVTDPKSIDLVVSNHTEMDHSGGLPRIMHAIGEEKPIYCSKMGLKNLPLHYPRKLNYQGVSQGETLELGKRTLQFLETRMLHWPDNMFTFVQEDGILFSSDAFGQHYAGYEKFDDVVGDAIWPHAKKYFANILMLYGAKTLKLLESVAAMDLDIRMICPDHGVCWRKNPERIIDAYGRWSRQETKNKAVLIYDSMWHSTEMMASAIGDGLTDEGINVRPMSLKKWHRSDIMTEVLDARGVIVGSPTLNNTLFPTVADILTYMKGLRPENKLSAAFGSYGWSGEAVKHINAELEAMKLPLFDAGLRIQYIPDEEQLESCRVYGRKFGAALKAFKG